MAGLEANRPANTYGMQRTYDDVISGVFVEFVVLNVLFASNAFRP